VRTLPSRVHGARKALLVLAYCASSLLWGPSADAAFHLERAEPSWKPTGYAPIESNRWVNERPAPRPVVRQRPVVAAAAPTRSNGSTNRYVSPWGCEARHAQQWSYAKDKNGNPIYWGKYQFDRQTWAAHGGDPAAYGSAPEAEQDRIASRVRYDAWPNC
jgi:hypothetical protein